MNTNRLMRFWLTLALLFPLLASAQFPFHKCKLNGVTHYQQTPCPTGETRKPPTVEELNAERLKKLAEEKATAPPPVHPAPIQPASLDPSKIRLIQNQAPQAASPSPFKCDGRQHCSQMHSCAEAKYFLANCPGVKMDGNHDGTPCEQQWCRP